VALSGFVLVVLLFHAAAQLAMRAEGRAERVRRITTYSYVHHAAVVGTFALLSVWSAFAGREEMVAILVFAVVACTIGVGITALVRSAARSERDDDA
jgi:cytochrome bd-type quinol oxidase subunit 2